MLKSRKTFLFLKTPSYVGGTFIKKLTKTMDLLEKWEKKLVKKIDREPNIVWTDLV